jgi:hypothetical protein
MEAPSHSMPFTSHLCSSATSPEGKTAASFSVATCGTDDTLVLCAVEAPALLRSRHDRENLDGRERWWLGGLPAACSFVEGWALARMTRRRTMR